jgi:hypothetical protein
MAAQEIRSFVFKKKTEEVTVNVKAISCTSFQATIPLPLTVRYNQVILSLIWSYIFQNVLVLSSGAVWAVKNVTKPLCFVDKQHCFNHLAECFAPGRLPVSCLCGGVRDNGGNGGAETEYDRLAPF